MGRGLRAEALGNDDAPEMLECPSVCYTRFHSLSSVANGGEGWGEEGLHRTSHTQTLPNPKIYFENHEALIPAPADPFIPPLRSFLGSSILYEVEHIFLTTNTK